MHRRTLLGIAAGLAPLSLWADEALWTLLKSGEHVVLVRHGLTTPGVGDPPGMRLDACATQRNLVDEGRDESRRLGEAWRRRNIPLGRVLSSPWCRCLETGRLAFGREPEVNAALSNLFDRGPQPEQLARLKALVSQRPTGGNTVMVTHGSTVSALVGVQPATAEMVVLTARPTTGFSVAGRIKVN